MKAAILGYSSSALEMTLKLYDEGASPKWFVFHQKKIKDSLNSKFDTNSLMSGLGQKILKDLNPDQKLEFDHLDQYFNSYFFPLLQFLKEQDCIIEGEVTSVSKRYLSLGEKPTNQDRFSDLFRVLYTKNPKIYLDQLENENPQVFNQLSDPFKQSLGSELELFDDFDIVFESVDFYQTEKSLSPVGSIMGERRLREDLIHYDLSLPLPIGDQKEILLTGSGAPLALALKELSSWLFEDASRRVFLVSTEAKVFDPQWIDWNSSFKHEIAEILLRSEKDYLEQMKKYENKLDEWMNLESYMKAKITMPELPIPQIVIFSGHQVMSLDKLIDQSRFFVSVEKPSFRESILQKENSQRDLKTLGVDLVISAFPKRKELSLFESLNLAWTLDRFDSFDNLGNHPEKGFFSLRIDDFFIFDSFKLAQKRRDDIWQSLKRLFSKVPTEEKNI
jgi:hypothetical protein